MNLSRKHINYVLGIKVPLNESIQLSSDLTHQIIYEQLIYENFLDTVKKYAGEKWDKIITTIKDWKDAAVVLGKTISNPEILQNFSDNFWKTFKNGDLKKIEALLKKLKLDNFIPQVESLINKITSLKGWQKFLAATSIASITNYIVTQLSTLSADGLKKWITAYFSDSALSTITSKLTDFTTYISWLQPIIKGTEILYNILKPTIDKFKFAFNLKPQTSENKMKKSQLKQIIKEEIKNMFAEAETAPQSSPISSKQATASKAAEVKKIVDFLTGSGKTALTNISSPAELNLILASIWNGMSETMKKNSSAIAIKKIIDSKLK